MDVLVKFDKFLLNAGNQKCTFSNHDLQTDKSKLIKQELFNSIHSSIFGAWQQEN